MYNHVQRIFGTPKRFRDKAYTLVFLLMQYKIQNSCAHIPLNSSVPMAVDHHSEDCRGKISAATDTEVEELMKAATNIACTHNSKCKMFDRNPEPLTFTMFCGHPRSGHSLIGSIIDSNLRAVVSNEYDFAQHVLHPTNRLIPSRLNTTSRLEAQLFHMLLNSRQCSKKRIQAGYNYTFPHLFQGQWMQPPQQLQVIGDKKGGGTARALARHFEYTLASIADELRPIDESMRLAILNIIRNPWDQIASTFARGWFHTHPDDVEDKNVFQSSEFRRIGPTLVFQATSTREDLRQRGNLVRNLIGRILDFFELQRATDSLETLLSSNRTRQTPTQETKSVTEVDASLHEWWKTRAEFMKINYDDFTVNPKTWISDICVFLRLSCTEDFLESTAKAVGAKQSHPSQFIHWPSNVVHAVRVCLNQHPSLHHFQHFQVPKGASILTDMDDVWSMVTRNTCVFHPVNGTVLFQRTPIL
eukprot:m.126172 g.126172  ORF g.126172 m.126172 type:complete len:472 (+) comp17356_c0_seq1:419-1834(+)